MLWFNHPAYVKASTDAIRSLKSRPAQLKRLRPIVFLCGGKDSARRDRLSEYLRKYSDFLLFYAEDVFEALIRNEPNANALELEGELAELADAVVVIAESPGTFAELGAFAMNKSLRRKLLPIADKAFRGDQSFLQLGPLRWTDQDSTFGPAMWTDLSVILSIADAIKRRLETRIPRPTITDVKKLILNTSPRHLLFLMTLLLEIFGPLSTHQLGVLLEELAGSVDSGMIQRLLGLAAALNLAKTEHIQGELVHFRWRAGGHLGQMTQITPFAIATMRTYILSALQTIPAATAALDLLADRLRSAA
jgi:hypothetical protein